jgi:nucleoid-associated protein YgaU
MNKELRTINTSNAPKPSFIDLWQNRSIAPEKIRNRKKAAWTLGVSASVLALGLMTPKISDAVTTDCEGSTEVIIKPGDTIWSIAEARFKNSDLQDVRDEIVAMNKGVEPGQLQAGIAIKIPESCD